MRVRALVIFTLACLACGGFESEGQPTPRDPVGAAGRAGEAQRPEDPPREPPPLCLFAGVACIEAFTVTLEAAEPWPQGRYFLRVALDRGEATVCEIAFEPVLGAVTDTCNGDDSEFRVDYRYDEEARAILGVSFGRVRRVDMEIVVADDLPPLVEVHHDVVVQKCSYGCDVAAPLVAQVQLSSGMDAGVDAADGDSGVGHSDASADAAF